MDKTHKKYAKQPRNNSQKKEYQVADEALIKKILTHGSHGILASTNNHQPFITPLIYLHDDKEHSVYFHGTRTGRFRANLHFNPKIAFNVLEFGNILAHKEASEFNVAYNSVTIFGTARTLDDEKMKSKLLQSMGLKFKIGHANNKSKPQNF
ncbi:MAG: pyridoxamine 5'-phosphate oxidase family protein [Anaerolineales bacterium]